MNKYHILLFLLLPTLSLADDERRDYVYFKFAPGIFNSARLQPFQTKNFTLGYQLPLGSLFVWQNEMGVMLDNGTSLGGKNSMFLKSRVGVDIQVGWFYSQALFGGALISAPDAYLGSIPNFNESLGFGIRDFKGLSIGLEYEHISNGGLAFPNIGRDSLGLKISIPLGQRRDGSL